MHNRLGPRMEIPAVKKKKKNNANLRSFSRLRFFLVDPGFVDLDRAHVDVQCLAFHHFLDLDINWYLFAKLGKSFEWIHQNQKSNLHCTRSSMPKRLRSDGVHLCG